jgi:hypothetical protein
MSNKRITDLTELTTLTANDVFPVVDIETNITKKIKASNIVSPPSGVSGAIQFSNGSAFASDVNNLFWNDSLNRLGVGTNSPSATGHFKGSGSTSSTSSLLVENSLGINALTVKDDLTTSLNGALNFPKSYTGFNEPNIFITAQNQPNPESFANVDSFNLSIGTTYIQDGVNPFYTGYGNTYVGLGNSAIAGGNSYFNCIIGYASSITVAEPGNLIMGYQSFSSVANATVIGRQASVSGFNGSAFGYLATTSTENGFAIGNSLSKLQIGGNFTPNARIHAKGLGDTSATAALLIQNSSSAESFKVRDDGVIICARMPTSSAGLPSGALWNDSGTIKIV